jgi:hypothetical protein
MGSSFFADVGDILFEMVELGLQNVWVLHADNAFKDSCSKILTAANLHHLMVYNKGRFTVKTPKLHDLIFSLLH